MIKGSCHCGSVHWSFDGVPESCSTCNCTVCRRYGVLWAYDYVDELINVQGETTVYQRGDEFGGDIEFHFCGNCGCVAYWIGAKVTEDERRRIAVNLRLSEPGLIRHIPIERFDGLETFSDLPRDGRCVSDYWF